MGDPTRYTNVDLEAGGKYSVAGVTIDASPAAQNESLIGSPLKAAISVGAEVGDVINVDIQMQDGDGADLTNIGTLAYYLADDAAGLTPTTSQPDGGVAIGTDGSSLGGFIISEVDGHVDLDITHSASGTWYMVLIHPNNKIRVSEAITFS